MTVKQSRAPAKPRRPLDVLRGKQRLFVQELLRDDNGTRAYLASHPGCKSRKAAASEAYKLLRNPQIRAAIEAGRQAQYKRLEMQADEALALISQDARADILDAYDEAGVLLPVHEWPACLRRSVRSIRPGPYGDTITLNDSLKARELMAQAGGKLKSKFELELNLAKLLAGEEDEPDDGP